MPEKLRELVYSIQMPEPEAERAVVRTSMKIIIICCSFVLNYVETIALRIIVVKQLYSSGAILTRSKMSYVTQDTIWPDSKVLDSKVKDVISLFYELADDTSAEAGPRMASEVFASNAKIVIGTGTFEGSEGKLISRAKRHALTLNQRFRIAETMHGRKSLPAVIAFYRSSSVTRPGETCFFWARRRRICGMAKM